MSGQQIGRSSSRTGFCKLCDSELRGEINRRLKVGLSAPKIMRYAAEHGLPVSKPTVLKHKRHITDPKVTLVKQAQRDPAIRPLTDEEYLDAVRDAAARNIAESPELVTVSEGIRAVQARPQGKGNVDILLAIAGFVCDRTAYDFDDEGRMVLPSEPRRIGMADDDDGGAAA